MADVLNITNLIAQKQFTHELMKEAISTGDSPTDILNWCLTNLGAQGIAENLDSIQTLIEIGSDANTCLGRQFWLEIVLDDMAWYDFDKVRQAKLKQLVLTGRSHGMKIPDDAILRLAGDAVHLSSYEFMEWFVDWLLENGLDANATVDAAPLFIKCLNLNGRPFSFRISLALLQHGADAGRTDTSGKSGYDHLQAAIDQLMGSDDEEYILELAKQVSARTGYEFRISPQS